MMQKWEDNLTENLKDWCNLKGGIFEESHQTAKPKPRRKAMSSLPGRSCSPGRSHLPGIDEDGPFLPGISEESKDPTQEEESSLAALLANLSAGGSVGEGASSSVYTGDGAGPSSTAEEQAGGHDYARKAPLTTGCSVHVSKPRGKSILLQAWARGFTLQHVLLL